MSGQDSSGFRQSTKGVGVFSSTEDSEEAMVVFIQESGLLHV